MKVTRFSGHGGKRKSPRWASAVNITGVPDPAVWALLGSAVALFALLTGLAASGALTGGRATERWAGRVEATVGVISSMRLVDSGWWRPRGPSYEIGYEYRPLTAVTGPLLHGSQRVEARFFSALRPGDAIEIFYLTEKPRESRILVHTGDQRAALVVLFGAFLLLSCYLLAANIMVRFGAPGGGRRR